MNRQGHETANFFVGTEVEASPVAGHRTLFVVGLQDADQIMWQLGESDRKSKNPITHIYFGANQSFPNPTMNDAEPWDAWERMVQHWLDRGYWCTLDLDVSAVDGLCEGGLCEQETALHQTVRLQCYYQARRQRFQSNQPRCMVSQPA
jgi:hypothetical protein